MIKLARRRLTSHSQVAGLLVGDATRMPYRNELFDAVFESGVVHHVPNWRATLREVGRVLKPGGSFYFGEPSRGRLRRGLYRLLPHRVESMFDAEEWRSALAKAGLAVEEPLQRLPLWDICGVASKA
jgi:ubiquinone/menaquinone biosynthesis C-methylase UbiE